MLRCALDALTYRAQYVTSSNVRAAIIQVIDDGASRPAPEIRPFACHPSTKKHRGRTPNRTDFRWRPIARSLRRVNQDENTAVSHLGCCAIRSSTLTLLDSGGEQYRPTFLATLPPLSGRNERQLLLDALPSLVRLQNLFDLSLPQGRSFL